jgi:hypothetical protein
MYSNAEKLSQVSKYATHYYQFNIFTFIIN